MQVMLLFWVRWLLSSILHDLAARPHDDDERVGQPDGKKKTTPTRFLDDTILRGILYEHTNDAVTKSNLS